MRDLLTVHRAQLDSLAQALLKEETLDEVYAYLAAAVHKRPAFTPPPASNGSAAARR